MKWVSMKNDLLGAASVHQDEIRSRLWAIFNKDNHTIHSLCRMIGITHNSLKNFFRGDTVSRKTMIRIDKYLSIRSIDANKSQ